ncbi:MAG: TraR/DksA family transcriptional regulator [Aquabacterium sp.]|jgi:DnaK suppressor protein|uniref:TraR/DksA family transcriptional regulator n=1 Tax=Aquabacterium sp. TaxID=1872578 RepID=UPI002A35BED4|nr:TraR/DksA family transcriptional regulator [Aquabacterium sp.]MDX9842163.1 TraR/DksA family transcriptional regulator [Aquabacterium sp.]
MSASQSDNKLVVAPESGLNETLVRGFQSRLQAALKDLSAEDHDLRQKLASDEVATEHAVVDGAESALSVESNLEVITQIQHERQEMGDILAALDRITAGEYGLCTECGAPIGEARLSVVPEASHCIDCQEAAERHPGH